MVVKPKNKYILKLNNHYYLSLLEGAHLYT